MSRTSTGLVSAVLLLGCNEYDIAAKNEAPAEVDTEVPEVEQPVPSCAEVSLQLLDWAATAPFVGQTDPMDSQGRAFWEQDFDESGLSSVSIPDVGNIPAGMDRVYVATLSVSGVPPGVALDLQSDDGLAVWLDGELLGRWGGGWQQEGCVNDQANCVSFDIVAPIDVTERLLQGDHRVALRVSNPVEGSYASVAVRCTD